MQQNESLNFRSCGLRHLNKNILEEIIFWVLIHQQLAKFPQNPKNQIKCVPKNQNTEKWLSGIVNQTNEYYL